jgi:hypothetical protein
MRTPSNPENGIVAILDALGAASYGIDEINRFMDSRRIVLELLNEKAEDVLGVSRAMVTTFTFNDTILIILRTGSNEPKLKQITDFFMIIRKFLVDSLAHRILFRGSIAVGTFYADDDTSTVMGPAVTDAAAWYDKANWIGVQATPRTALVIERWLEHHKLAKAYAMLDYDVPLKLGGSVRTKVVNWPKVFFVERITPCEGSTEPKEKLLEFLMQHQVPWGTEDKFYNTLAFFEYAVGEIKKEKRSKKR